MIVLLHLTSIYTPEKQHGTGMGILCCYRGIHSYTAAKTYIVVLAVTDKHTNVQIYVLYLTHIPVSQQLSMNKYK